MTSKPVIDLWNLGSYDAELLALLSANQQIILDYWAASHRMDAEREADPDNLALRFRDNPHRPQYQDFRDYQLTGLMNDRTILAYHYTRMTDDEVAYIRAHGIELSTLTSLRRRLDARVVAKDFDQETADQIFAKSPLHSEGKFGLRSGMFWMVSPAPPPYEGGTELLLENWGGEVAYWLNSRGKHPFNIGRPRILEIALPLNATDGAFRAAQAVLEAFLRSLGTKGDSSGFDINAKKSLPPEAILRVITEGEPAFEEVGHHYRALHPPYDDDEADEAPNSPAPHN